MPGGNNNQYSEPKFLGLASWVTKNLSSIGGEFGSGSGEDGEDFEIYIDPPNQGVIRYELQAWGR